ncbi:M28 family peptidase [bacterium]|nr:M28 family peptidase [bacterium]
MKSLSLLVVCMTLSLTAQEKTDTSFFNYFPTITADRLAGHLYFIASDLTEGRETSTRGQKITANYIANQYRMMGVKPMGTVKTTDPFAPDIYFQPFSVYKRAKPNSTIEVRVNNAAVITSSFSLEHQDDLAYFASGEPKDVQAGIVFAGYGIAADSLKYNDFKALSSQKISITGKWVLIFADEPLLNDSTSLLPTANKKVSAWSKLFLTKITSIIQAGQPAGVLVIGDLSPRQKLSIRQLAAQTLPQFDRIGGVTLKSDNSSAFLPPTYVVSSQFADAILKNTGYTSASLQQAINKNLKPVVMNVKDVEVVAKGEHFDALPTENVLGYIEGSDPILKNEVIVVSAHYDHLGKNDDHLGHDQQQKDQIFNGAADDGSGTAAVLTIAQAFMNAKNAGQGPKRSILFLNTSAEEKGILGSRFYTVDQPVIPLERTVVNINMDGVGGIDLKHPTKSKNYIYLVSSPVLSKSLVDINSTANKLINDGLEITPNAFPSDHINFAVQMIPYLYYSTGLTEHYHKVTDEPQTIDYEHLARVTRLVFATTWTIANKPNLNLPDRTKFKINGYICPPCNLPCDNIHFDKPGVCPVCQMALAPNVLQ